MLCEGCLHIYRKGLINERSSERTLAGVFQQKVNDRLTGFTLYLVSLMQIFLGCETKHLSF